MNSEGFFISATMCRTCLRRDAEKELYSFHKPTSLQYYSILKSCIPDLEVESNDGLPKYICLKCLKLLVSYYKFKNMVIENDTKLQNVLKKCPNQVQCETNQNTINEDVQQLFIVQTHSINDNQLLIDNGVSFVNEIGYDKQTQEHDTGIMAKDICIVTDSESSSDSGDDFDEQKKLSNYKTFQCEICGNIFSSRSNLNKHIRSHTGERPYSCDICQKKFFKAEHALIHKRIHTGERPHKCLICSKRFIQYAALKNHLKTHTGERPHICSTCGKSFSQSSTLVYHMRTHSGETPYICQICNKGFKNAGNLRIHLRFHGNERNYVCNICDKRFVTSSHLNVHIKQHNGDRPHKCVVCGKGFVRSEHLKIHLIIHSGQKPFYCKMCPRRFTQNSHLRRHMKTHQQETVINQSYS